MHNAGVFTDYYGSAKVVPRICRYCCGLPWISIIYRITPIVLNILKYPGSNSDCHGSPVSCHGLANARSTLGPMYDEGCPHRVADKSNCDLRRERITIFVSTPQRCTFSSRGTIHAIWCVPKENYTSATFTHLATHSILAR